MDFQGGCDHARPHLRRAEQCGTHSAVAVAALTRVDGAGRRAEVLRFRTHPNTAEVKIVLPQIAKHLVAQFAACDVARRIDNGGLATAGTGNLHRVRVTGFGDDIARDLLLGMDEVIPEGKLAAGAPPLSQGAS